MSMNDFEKRMSALRRQFAAERDQITKDCERTIGRLNTAIGMVNSPEARDVLRAEKHRLYEAMRTSHRYNRLCYMQQLEALEDEYRLHLEQTPSKNQLRRLMWRLSRMAEEQGETSLHIAFGDNKKATITFE